MHKKIVLVILLILILIITCSCGRTKVTDDTGQEREIFYGLVIADTLYNGGGIEEQTLYVAYDRQTKICYLLAFGGHRLAISPYYIVKDGKPEIAIYGKNYKEGYGDFK